MKYKLTKEAIEELKAMELESNRLDRFILGQQVGELIYDLWLNRDIEVFEPIAEKLPKPVLKSIDDLKALEGWEYQFKHNAPSIWFDLKLAKYDLLDLSKAKIRQIDMPENEYLVADCIEQEIEVGDIAKHEGGFIGLVQSIWGSDPVEVELGNKTDEYCYNLNQCKLIRKASEITQSDREKYLGEKAEEPNIWKGAHKEVKAEPFEFEAKVREIIKKVLKEEAGE